MQENFLEFSRTRKSYLSKKGLCLFYYFLEFSEILCIQIVDWHHFLFNLYGWLQIKLELMDSQQVRGLVEFDDLSGSNPQDQIKSEIVPCWLLSIAGSSGDCGNIDQCLSYQLMVKWGSRWRSNVCLGARSHERFLVWIRIHFAIRKSCLRRLRPFNHILVVSSQYILEGNQGLVENTWELP